MVNCGSPGQNFAIPASTTPEYLPTDRPHPSWHPSFQFWFWIFRDFWPLSPGGLFVNSLRYWTWRWTRSSSGCNQQHCKGSVPFYCAHLFWAFFLLSMCTDDLNRLRIIALLVSLKRQMSTTKFFEMLKIIENHPSWIKWSFKNVSHNTRTILCISWQSRIAAWQSPGSQNRRIRSGTWVAPELLPWFKIVKLSCIWQRIYFVL